MKLRIFLKLMIQKNGAQMTRHIYDLLRWNGTRIKRIERIRETVRDRYGKCFVNRKHFSSLF